MKVYILYHPQSDHSRSVEEYATDFERTKSKKIELLSLESPEGADMAQLYDVVQYPAVIAQRDNGELVKSWEGAELPLMDEVAAYTN